MVTINNRTEKELEKQRDSYFYSSHNTEAQPTSIVISEHYENGE
jgi:hypothetical protein